MDLRTTFNEDESNYDKARPTYPNELFEDIFSYKNLSAGNNLLEIGIGTGQATTPFLNKGCSVSAVELGDKLASYCRQKFSSYSNFSIINSDFLEADLPQNYFDLVYSATAFHWIPKEEGYAKIKSLLKKDGAIALFWNHPFVSNLNDETNIASMKVYSKYRSQDKPKAEFDLSKEKEMVAELKKYGFCSVESRIYKRIRKLTIDEYISLINTYSDHIALPADIKNAFENEMRNAIGSVGGKINIYDTLDLYLARK